MVKTRGVPWLEARYTANWPCAALRAIQWSPRAQEDTSWVRHAPAMDRAEKRRVYRPTHWQVGS